MMLMESFVGFERRFGMHLLATAVIPSIPFSSGSPRQPESGAVLQRMLAHSQFCMSGDHTLEAAAEAVGCKRTRSRGFGRNDGVRHFRRKFVSFNCLTVPPRANTQFPLHT